ncbi:NADH dehydrogenase [Novosphingobium sp. PC22D]|uniref:NADH-quinone oxidoreductase subunit 5 family protein n=1 Tax=Novosphingobium sp. PC22D TaxID=1962403 RepID=UPI000BEF6E81|nr:proton-conducting transporter membrane subunit [Novosphingobium sp. PC22D]PEQ11534.1 NADH dehydrogenase [Novosphingobium sp. PC22D]
MLWALFLWPVAGGLVAGMGPRSRGWLTAWPAGVLALTLGLAILAAPDAGTVLPWGGGLTLRAGLTPLAHAVAMLVPAVAAMVVAYAAQHEHRPGLRRLIALMLVFVGGMELLVIAADFLTLLIGWELVGACSWALIGHRGHEDAPPASANFAFIVTRAGDLGLFLAAMATFAGSGSFAFADLAQMPPGLLALVAAGVLLSAASKSGQIPFAPWLFRAMDGPTSVSALLHAATMVAAGAYLLARLQPLLAPVLWFGPAVIAIGLLTALAGGGVALIQPHAKKLLAGSTSAHYGLMFVATGAGYPLIAIVHLLTHGFFKALLFLAAGVAGERAGDYQLRHMRFGRALPLTAAASAIGALALAGVPPLGGAWTKEEIASAAGEHSSLLAIAVMLAGALSAAYATRFQLAAFGRDGMDGTCRPGAIEKAALLLLALASLVLGLLWLPGFHDSLARTWDARLPHAEAWELPLSLALIAGGIVAGAALARRSELGTRGVASKMADWMGLPTLIDAGVTRPAFALASTAAAADDRIVDSPARGAAVLGRAAARLFARGDGAVVDRGVRASSAFGRWLAQLSSGMGERLADALPEATAGGVGTGGRLAVRMQTGMTHQYYATVAGGILLIVALVFWGTA